MVNQNLVSRLGLILKNTTGGRFEKLNNFSYCQIIIYAYYCDASSTLRIRLRFIAVFKAMQHLDLVVRFLFHVLLNPITVSHLLLPQNFIQISLLTAPCMRQIQKLSLCIRTLCQIKSFFNSTPPPITKTYVAAAI